MRLSLEKQTCSLKWAKKMKELRFVQNSVWYWGDKLWLEKKKQKYGLFNRDDRFCPLPSKALFSAYTVAELLKLIHDMTGMLPVLHDRDLKPEAIPDYLAETACNLKKED